MKITKSASGKKEIRISKKEWQTIGKKAGWMRTKKAAMTEEKWNSLTPDEKRTKARNTMSALIGARIGMGLNDLPDTPQIQIDNWWDASMGLSETSNAIQEAVNEVCSSLEEEGLGSRFF